MIFWVQCDALRLSIVFFWLCRNTQFYVVLQHKDKMKVKTCVSHSTCLPNLIMIIELALDTKQTISIGRELERERGKERKLLQKFTYVPEINGFTLKKVKTKWKLCVSTGIKPTIATNGENSNYWNTKTANDVSLKRKCSKRTVYYIFEWAVRDLPGK